MSDIIRVPFYGDEIEATRDGDDVLVGIKRACENVGVQAHGQQEKLKSQPWATTQIICAVAEDGKTREMLFLHLDCVPMWLATIEASRVNPAIRDKLVRYQKDCARVLRDHFFGKPQNLLDAGLRCCTVCDGNHDPDVRDRCSVKGDPVGATDITSRANHDRKVWRRSHLQVAQDNRSDDSRRRQGSISIRAFRSPHGPESSSTVFRDGAWLVKPTAF